MKAVNFGTPADMCYKTLNVITLPSGAVIYSHEHKTYESWLAAQTPSFQQLEVRHQVRREKIWAIVQKQADKAKRIERKPIFDRHAAQLKDGHHYINPNSWFGQMIAAELQKAGM